MSETTTTTRKPRGPRVYPPIQGARDAMALQEQLNDAMDGYNSLPDAGESETIVERATRTGLTNEIERLMKAIRKLGFEPEGGLIFAAPAPEPVAA